MKIKNSFKIKVFGVFTIILVVSAYLFLFGKLFPYSPLIIGFEKHELQNTVIYIQNNTIFKDYKKIDELIPSIEDFHQLNYLKKPEIFIFRDKSSFLQHSISNARFCVYYNSRLFIAPWALEESNEGKISLKIYLIHELSHSLLHQHAGIINAYKYPEWLLEGIAVYSSNQMGTSFYPSKEKTYLDIKKGNFMPPDFFKTKKEDSINLDVEYRIPFMYSEFACIVDYLILTKGKNAFLVFMKTLLIGENSKDAFKRIYGIDFEKFILNFKEIIIVGNSQPSSNNG